MMLECEENTIETKSTKYETWYVPACTKCVNMDAISMLKEINQVPKQFYVKYNMGKENNR